MHVGAGLAGADEEFLIGDEGACFGFSQLCVVARVVHFERVGGLLCGFELAGPDGRSRLLFFVDAQYEFNFVQVVPFFFPCGGQQI